MTEAELRGIVLQDFYLRRNTMGTLRVADILILLSGNDQNRITDICRQLDRHELIKWSVQESALASFGSITPNGIRVVERTAEAPLDLVLPPGVGAKVVKPITMSPPFSYDELVAAINQSDASPLEKAEAKQLLLRVAGNALLQTALSSSFNQF